LSTGHLITDISQGALVILLPFFKSTMGLSYASSALIIALATITSSISQPLFGHLADRSSKLWLLPLGCFLSGVGIALSGVSRMYWLLLPAIVVSGLGVAAFHPEAARNAHRVAGHRKATGMSLYAVGGNMGYAFGTLMMTPLIVWGGRFGAGYIAIPAVLTTVFLWRSIGRFRVPRAAPEAKTADEADVRKSALRPMVLLIITVAFRSWVQTGLATFLPLYWRFSEGMSQARAGWMIFIYLMFGALGTVIGGPIADRWGRKPLLITTMLATVPLTLLYLYTDGPASLVLLALSGVVLISSFSVTVVMAQELMPHRTGTAAGLMIGFAIGMGGLGVYLLGYFADHFGPFNTLILISLLPIPGALLGLLLKEPRRGRVVKVISPEEA
jgi:MFS transporter, FSR family, fosmidomycin resistance protein